VRALELLGKKLDMWVDHKVVEEVSTHRDIADKVWEIQQAIDRGEDVEPIKDSDVEEKTAEIIEFEIKDGDGTDG
jgi:hypothetical protein